MGEAKNIYFTCLNLRQLYWLRLIPDWNRRRRGCLKRTCLRWKWRAVGARARWNASWGNWKAIPWKIFRWICRVRRWKWLPPNCLRTKSWPRSKNPAKPFPTWDLPKRLFLSRRRESFQMDSGNQPYATELREKLELIGTAKREARKNKNNWKRSLKTFISKISSKTVTFEKDTPTNAIWD